MNIYLAGPCDTENRTVMVKIAKMIRNLKHDVYCPWELKIENAWDYSQEHWARMVFDKDVMAIDKSDAVILISVGRKSTAGTNWEQGYAYALKKPVYVIQITQETTSLMTYCGCTAFFNSDTSDHDLTFMIHRINELLNGKDFPIPEKCETVLT